jgi:3-oxoadipate enol-lactonase
MTDSVSVGGVRLACRVDGEANARAILLIHSLGTNMGSWDGQADALGVKFRVARYDARGHGQSEDPLVPVTIEQLGLDALAVLDNYGMERAHVCGLSMGGMTALWLAACHPERVGRAVFANTAARIGTVESWSARIEAVRVGGMAAVREPVLARFLSAGFRTRRPEVAAELGDMLEATSPVGYVAACEALRDADLRGIVGRIRVPSLIIAGALDPSTPPSQAEELHAAIQGSELVVLPDAAHLSNVEQPALFNRYLWAFLAD